MFKCWVVKIYCWRHLESIMLLAFLFSSVFSCRKKTLIVIMNYWNFLEILYFIIFFWIIVLFSSSLVCNFINKNLRYKFGSIFLEDLLTLIYWSILMIKILYDGDAWYFFVWKLQKVYKNFSVSLNPSKKCTRKIQEKKLN
jgi:hypothetical protein